jgi:hypothetical protein
MNTSVSIPLAIAALAGALLLGGCPGHVIELREGMSVPAGEGVAFGRLQVAVNGATKSSLSPIGLSTIGLAIVSEASGRGEFVQIGGDGVFFLHLPRGRYRIASFSGMAPHSSASAEGRVGALFDAAPDTACYLGTLKLDFRGSAYALSVKDDFGQDRGLPATRFSELDLPVQRCLMALEARR